MAKNDTANPDNAKGKGSWALIVRDSGQTSPKVTECTMLAKSIELQDSLIKDDADFKISALSKLVGVTLKAVPYPSERGRYYNGPMRMLFCDPDPTSPRFLWPTGIEEETGDMLVRRVDGKPLSFPQFEGLYIFINENFIKHSRLDQAVPLFGMSEGSAKEERKRRILSKITPEAAHTFFEEYRRHRIREGRSDFKGVVSPVLLSFDKIDPACGRCLLTGTQEKPLLQCAKCHNRYYCKRDCQRADWKEHKKVCGTESASKG